MGMLNLCPSTLDPDAPDKLLATAIHEILHILVGVGCWVVDIVYVSWQLRTVDGDVIWVGSLDVGAGAGSRISLLVPLLVLAS